MRILLPAWTPATLHMHAKEDQINLGTRNGRYL